MANLELPLSLENKNWITTDEAAEFLELTPQAVWYNAKNGKYGEIREIDGCSRGRGGKIILIRPENLPAAAYLGYYTRHNQPPQVKELGPEWERATENQKQRAVAAHQRLIAWLDYRKNNPGHKGESDRNFIAAWQHLHPEDKVSLATLYRDLEKFKHGGLGALIPQHGLHRRGKEIIDPEAKATFITMYCDTAQFSISHCVEMLRTINIIRNKNWELPASKRTFERLIASYDQEVITLAREGKTAHNNKHGMYIPRNYESLQVMELWQSDHQEQDFFVRGPHGEIARPWQTVWMDARSRYVVGWHCSMGGNTDTIMAAFCDACLSHKNLIPLHIHIDNGRDYAGKRLTGGNNKFRNIEPAAVTAMIDHLKITTHFCIPENPQSKQIERIFGTLREYFDKYQQTYTGNNPKSRPETAEAARKAGLVMNWDDYVKASKDAWLYYNTRPHSGDGMNGKSPMEVFWEGVEKIKARRVDPEALRFMMWKTSDTRRVGRNGIRVDGRFYTSLELMEHQGKEVYVRYSPNLDTVWVFTTNDIELCKAQLVKETNWLDQDGIKEGMKLKYQMKRRPGNKLKELRAAADPVAQDKDELFKLQTEMAEQCAAKIKKHGPNVVEPVRTPFDKLAKEVVSTSTEAIIQRNSIKQLRRMAVAVGDDYREDPDERDRRISANFEKLYRVTQK